MRRAVIAGLAAVAASALLAPPAGAALPGTNGKIAFTSNGIYTMNPDGSGRTPIAAQGNMPAYSPDRQRIAFSYNGDIYLMDPDGSHLGNLTSSPGEEASPSWSPDGTRIAFQTNAGTSGNRVAVMSMYGQDRVYLTDGSGFGGEPAWSPDGMKIAFIASVPGEPGNYDVYTMNAADGTGVTRVTDTPGPSVVQEITPDWSPDGSKLAYAIYTGDIWTVNADGSGEQNLTSSAEYEADPSWSPDGSKIAFERRTFHETGCGPVHCVEESFWDVMTMDADGTDVQNLTNTIQGESELDPSWESIRPPEPPGYARPKGATPIRWSLVPAYRACSSPNREHGPPLAFGSCYPPTQTSSTITVGTPDSTGTPAESVGSVRIAVTPGNPATPANEAQVPVELQMTDVRRRSDFGDYSGELRLTIALRLTDKLNSTGITSSTAGTMQDGPGLAATVPCAPTADPAIGGTCALITTTDAVLPGAVVENKRAIWQLGEPQVLDGGPDGDADTTPNTLFARAGIFVP